MRFKKNVSIKYIVLDSAKPRIKDGNSYLPVYTQVVYEGKNTKFKTTILGKPVYVKENLGLLDTNFSDFKMQLEEVKKLIETIVYYEVDLLKERFTLKGLGKRIQFYFQSIEQVFMSLLDLWGVKDYLKSKLTYNQYVEWEKIENLNQKGIYLHNLSYGEDGFTDKPLSGLFKLFPDTPEPVKAGINMIMDWDRLKKLLPNDRITFYEWIFVREPHQLISNYLLLRKKYPTQLERIQAPKEDNKKLVDLIFLEEFVKNVDVMIPMMIRSLVYR